jgi:LacI family transcriptional regulator
VKHERVRATLADVAGAARTSKPIASRILNDDPTLTVGEALRRRVHDAARELGYRPHAAARSLRRAATGALGLLVPALGNPVYTQLMRGAFRRAGELGFTVVLAEDFEEQEAGELFARLVLEGRIDGLMIGSIRVDHPLLPLLAERPVPHVFVNRGVARSGRNVLMDDARAVELAVGHLVSLGHRSIVHLAGPPGLDPVERRAAAFRSCATASGLERAEVVHGGFLEQDGVDGARLTLERWPGVTAIFTGTVSQALGVLNVAWERGIQVPDELSVLAHADNQLAEYAVPPLTAVRMPLGELGAEAVTALVVQIETGASRDVLVGAAPCLALRASTAFPRRD